jgi:hypothetical protein
VSSSVRVARLAAVLFVLGVAALVGFAVSGVVVSTGPPALATADYRGAQGPLAPGVTNVPVLVYHELNNGCPASDQVCEPHIYGGSSDPESVSSAQLGAQLQYLHDAGYHTVTMAQYLAWINDAGTPLPAKPILLIADNGIGPFLEDAQPILVRNRDYMTAAVVTGFADGAAGVCPDPRLQPGCGAQNRNWDLTWPELRDLGAQYDFILEAGRSGHFQQNYNAHCQMFYACKLPGETAAGYERRVVGENAAGRAELRQQLGSRASTAAWVVPYSDLGYQQCALSDCTPQDSTGPPGWLVSWAARQYRVVFVEDADRNAIANERFRIDVNGWMNLSYFKSLLTADTLAGDFSH